MEMVFKLIAVIFIIIVSFCAIITCISLYVCIIRLEAYLKNKCIIVTKKDFDVIDNMINKFGKESLCQKI